MPLPVFPRMPDSENIDDILLYFVTHFIVSRKNSKHFPLIEFFEFFTYPRLLHNSVRHG